jgi:D-alanyl-D-alanine carboxypeptidase
MKKFLIIIALVGIVGAGWLAFNSSGDNTKGSNDSTATKSEGAFDKKQHSLDDPDSIWIIANKHRPLNPQKYIPSDLRAPDVALRLTPLYEEMQLREVAAKAVEQMFADAKKDKLDLMVASAFRAYSYQEGLYKQYVSQQGQATADTQSARPGYSEHQTGLAIDIEPASKECEIETCFADTPEGKWIARNAYKYGFVLRYHEDKEDITGYIYEPWHLRYVGKPLALELRNQNDPTLEEYFELEPAPSYQ